jgi:hypothetical protein
MTWLSNMTRPKGDPKIIEMGPRRSLLPVDRLACNLGWFSVGLGLAELFAADRLTRALGLRGKEDLVRAYGLREIASGVMCLSVDRNVGLWSRVAGDALDLSTLSRGLHPANGKRGNVALAMALVVGVTALDILAAQKSGVQHARNADETRDYGDRSGFPGGLAAARSTARKAAQVVNAAG